MLEEDFDVSAIAAQGVLIVSVRVPTYADRRAIERNLYALVSVFAAVEGLDPSCIEGLRWDKSAASKRGDYYVLRRAFTDPEYPRRFERALSATSAASAKKLRFKPRRSIAALLFQRPH